MAELIWSICICVSATPSTSPRSTVLTLSFLRYLSRLNSARSLRAEHSALPSLIPHPGSLAQEHVQSPIDGCLQSEAHDVSVICSATLASNTYPPAGLACLRKKSKRRRRRTRRSTLHLLRRRQACHEASTCHIRHVARHERRRSRSVLAVRLPALTHKLH